MTKWANPTSRRRVHPAWYLILFLACIVALLAVTCQGCAATGNKGVDTSRTATTTVRAPEVHGDNARVTTISLTSVGGYGWGGLATLVGFVLWTQKRTRETAAKRMCEAIQNAEPDANHTNSLMAMRQGIKRRISSEGFIVREGTNLPADAAERWINRQVKRL